MTHDQGAAGATAADQSMVQAEGFWQLPAILFTTWWNAMAAAWLPATVSHVHGHSAHDQLVVPEPLEETGEHALFA